MNEARLSSLPTVRRTGYIPASLVTENGERYEFLYNPEKIENSKRAVYTQADVPIWSVQPLQYGHSEGIEKRFPDLILDGWSDEKSVEPIIKELTALLEADVANGKLRPQHVTFSWGQKSFGPAVITELQWIEQSWLDGIEGYATVSFTLKEVPKGLDTQPIDTEQRTELDFSSINETEVVNLTARQKNDAIAGALSYVQDNLNSLDIITRSAFQQGSFSWDVSDLGEVSLKDLAGQVLARIGTWNPSDLNFGGLL